MKVLEGVGTVHAELSIRLMSRFGLLYQHACGVAVGSHVCRVGMPDQTCVIQFPHPGPEPLVGADVQLIPWNRGRHRRKFLYANGTCVKSADAANSYSGPLALWGEWESEAHVVRRWEAEGKLPRTAFAPSRCSPPCYSGLQNTDPFVFGGPFLYGNCGQYTNGLTRPTMMRELAPGSVILFGSKVHDAFVLDTILVVHDSVYYDVRRPSAILDLTPPTYAHVTIQPLAADPIVKSSPMAYAQGLRLYRGATPDKRIGAMFSFVPCAKNPKHDARFPRPPIVLDQLVNPRNAQARRRTICSEAAAERAWHSVVSQVLAAGLALGVAFDPPHERQ